MRAILPVLLVVLALGCGGAQTAPEVQPPPSYDPDALAAAALAEYDANKNGTLDGAELDACPALKGALAGLDTDRDGKLSKAELRARFAEYAAARTGSVGLTATVTLDGQPLPDATVQFVPEAFMASLLQEATGKTGADGTVSAFTVGGAQVAGLQPGFYKVRITRDGGSQLPARYNTQTTLGFEVSGGRGARPPVFALASR
jgi:hypothetical protein